MCMFCDEKIDEKIGFSRQINTPYRVVTKTRNGTEHGTGRNTERNTEHGTEYGTRNRIPSKHNNVESTLTQLQFSTLYQR